MDDPDSSVSEVAGIIAMDPPMAAKVLSVANSAAYGFRQRVNDVTHAVSLLGLREAYGLVLSSAVVNFYSRSSDFDYRRFWAESMDCASVSRIIARQTGRETGYGLFSAALLHDLGRVALTEVIPELYSQVDQDLPPDQLLAREEEILGITHTEAGYALASKWDLPSEIAEPIRFHHQPELARSAQENVWIVSVAVAISRLEGHEEELDALFAKHGQTLEYLGLGLYKVGAIVNEFFAQGDSSAEVSDEDTELRPGKAAPAKWREYPRPKKIVICPKCDHRMTVPHERADQPGKCTKCGAIVNLPETRPPVREPEPMAPASVSELDELEPEAPGVKEPVAPPVTPDRAPVEPAAATPAPDKPEPEEPAPEEPEPEEPAPEEPAPVEPAPEEPALVEPVAAKPTPRKPTPAKPPAAKPAPAEPTPTRPAAPVSESPDIAQVGMSIVLWSVGFGVACSLFLGLAMMLVSRVFALDADEVTRYAPLRGFDLGLLYGLIAGSIWGMVRATALPFFIHVVISAAIGLVLSLLFYGLTAAASAPSEIGLLMIILIGGIGGAVFGFVAASVKEYFEEPLSRG
jgi:HD-like signal output (HDOD) protein